MFGYPGGAILPGSTSSIDPPVHFEPHEQRPGTVRMGMGPGDGAAGGLRGDVWAGAPTLLTRLLTAQIDSIPILVFSGQVLRRR